MMGRALTVMITMAIEGVIATILNLKNGQITGERGGTPGNSKLIGGRERKVKVM